MPNFLELRDDEAWDSKNDPNPGTLYSYNKPYLNYIHGLASQLPGYKNGFDLIYTTTGALYEAQAAINFSEPIWTLPLWMQGTGYTHRGFVYSAYPTFDMARPGMAHMSDDYLRYINEFLYVNGGG